MQPFAKPKRCVIADDVRASRKTVSAWLRQNEFECTEVEDGLLAWDAICEQPPDLLVTDLEMPNLCGLELLEKVRHAENEQIRQIPVLVMTSLRDGQTLNVVRSLGGSGLLHKPLDMQATLSVILNLVAGHDNIRSYSQCVGDAGSPIDGAISPTLRRLLKTVAKHESSG
ncbi:response regulator [Rubripirellula reticaptiva]|uniref:CAI-1 autoinducer sensor kinase/phosphatase CqsS n=1 Tax=Rubripirellula reticaptiva TaxID=2528013 RepID=A0A5C6EL98_9BACT|nr:response regulator [Rubripirellula reticaptiva]TWU48361.1 CAI-1 autoinducer sensor kinase/phosphatase CqsS [Rubripirellula reticaptiva]